MSSIHNSMLSLIDSAWLIHGYSSNVARNYELWCIVMNHRRIMHKIVVNLWYGGLFVVSNNDSLVISARIGQCSICSMLERGNVYAMIGPDVDIQSMIVHEHMGMLHGSFKECVSSVDSRCKSACFLFFREDSNHVRNISRVLCPSICPRDPNSDSLEVPITPSHFPCHPKKCFLNETPLIYHTH